MMVTPFYCQLDKQAHRRSDRQRETPADGRARHDGEPVLLPAGHTERPRHTQTERKKQRNRQKQADEQKYLVTKMSNVAVVGTSDAVPDREIDRRTDRHTL